MIDFQAKNDPVMRPVTDGLREALTGLARVFYASDGTDLHRSIHAVVDHPDFAALIAEPTHPPLPVLSRETVLTLIYAMDNLHVKDCDCYDCVAIRELRPYLTYSDAQGMPSPPSTSRSDDDGR